MWHPAAPCAGRVAGCTPTARGSPSHAFPGMCCGCTHVPTSPAMPEICLLLAGCSPKAREPVPELAAACWSCQDSFLQDCPCQAPWWGGKSALGWGNLPPGCREGATCVGPVRGCAQHLAARVCEDGQVLGATGGTGLSPSNAVHPCASRGSCLPSGGAWWQAALQRVRFLDGQR